MVALHPLDKKELLEYLKKIDKMEHILTGTDGTNGMRAMVKEHDLFIEAIKPQLVDLARICNALYDIKRNIYKVFWVAITASILSLGAKFIQIRQQDDNNQAIKANARALRLEEHFDAQGSNKE